MAQMQKTLNLPPLLEARSGAPPLPLRDEAAAQAGPAPLSSGAWQELSRLDSYAYAPRSSPRTPKSQYSEAAPKKRAPSDHAALNTRPNQTQSNNSRHWQHYPQSSGSSAVVENQGKIMDFHDFPRFLGKSGMDLMHPPKLCAGLHCAPRAGIPHARGAASSHC